MNVGSRRSFFLSVHGSVGDLVFQDLVSNSKENTGVVQLLF